MTTAGEDPQFLAQLDQVLPALYGAAGLDEFVVTAMTQLPLLVQSDALSYNEVNSQARRVKTTNMWRAAVIPYGHYSCQLELNRLRIAARPCCLALSSQRRVRRQD